jgi:hypothetical protein
MVFGAETMRKDGSKSFPHRLEGAPSEVNPSSRCCNSPLFLGLERNSRYGLQSIKIVGCSSPEGGMVMVGLGEG